MSSVTTAPFQKSDSHPPNHKTRPALKPSSYCSKSAHREKLRKLWMRLPREAVNAWQGPRNLERAGGGRGRRGSERRGRRTWCRCARACHGGGRPGSGAPSHSSSRASRNWGRRSRSCRPARASLLAPPGTPPPPPARPPPPLNHLSPFILHCPLHSFPPPCLPLLPQPRLRD